MDAATNQALPFSSVSIFQMHSRCYITTFDQASTYQITMSRRDVRFYKLTLQLPLSKPDATFRRKERKLEKPDVDFRSYFGQIAH